MYANLPCCRQRSGGKTLGSCSCNQRPPRGRNGSLPPKGGPGEVDGRRTNRRNGLDADARPASRGPHSSGRHRQPDDSSFHRFQPTQVRIFRFSPITNRLGTEGNDNLLAAAKASGVRRFIAQSYTGWPYARIGGPIKTETDPLDSDPPKTISQYSYSNPAFGVCQHPCWTGRNCSSLRFVLRTWNHE